jgi:hypothetical protein
MSSFVDTGSTIYMHCVVMAGENTRSNFAGDTDVVDDDKEILCGDFIRMHESTFGLHLFRHQYVRYHIPLTAAYF